MEKLKSIDSLMVSQQKELGEIITGFETKNKYIVSDMRGNRLYLAAEEAGSLLLRLFLKALRPFKVVVANEHNQVVIRIVRPFRFYFHEAEILDAQGRRLGIIKKRFSLLRRIYSVIDRTGQEVYQLFGPILHPWTFQIRKNDVELGKISKKWSGLLKEGFTDADNFGVMFPAQWEIEKKALMLGAVFLIDFVHFENKGHS
ncbi:MAG: phospholipid scramblase-related protein [Thioalkalispiraceae bacterium]|jgi:uncharacterized protein YxjI